MDQISNELLEAVKSGDINILETALKVKDVNPYAIDENGQNLMHHAAIVGNLECVKLLLNFNCSFGKQDFEGRTALLLACSKRTRLEVIQDLLHVPENYINVCDKNNVSPLMAACLHSTPQIVEALIQCGADLDLKDSNNHDAIWYAQESGDIENYSLILSALVCNEYEVIGHMRTANLAGVPTLPFQTRIWFRDEFGWSLLHWSVIRNNLECLEIALKLGCDPLQRDALGRAPLHLACHFGADFKIVEKFLDELIDVVNEPDWSGVTPLMAACRVSHPNVVEALLQVGAKINLVDLYDHSALWYAKYYNRMDLFTLLMQYGADPAECKNLDFAPINLNITLDPVNNFGEDGYTPLIRAVRKNDVKSVTMLIKEGAKVDLLDKDSHTALWHAVSSDNEEICKILTKAGAQFSLVSPNVLYCTRRGDSDELSLALESDLSLNLVDAWGNNALHLACMNRDITCIRILLQAGVPTKTRNKWGATPLFTACVSEACISIIRDLISYDKESVNICTKNLNSPLMAACKLSTLNVVSHLIESEADVNHENIDGHTSLLYAYTSGNHDIYQLLLSKGANPIKGGVCLVAFYVEYILSRWNSYNDLATGLLRKNLETTKLTGDVFLNLNEEELFPLGAALKTMKNFVKLLLELDQIIHFASSDDVHFDSGTDVLTLRICAATKDVLIWLCSQSAAIDPDKLIRKNVVHDLKHLSRRAVRKTLARNARCETDFCEVLEDTPLPRQLRDYIRFL